jgi:integrase
VRGDLGNILICEIEARDIVAYQRARVAEGAAGATINKEIACLSSILRDCGVWEQVRRDVKKLEENEEAGRALSRKEERRLLDWASRIGRHQGKWTPLYTVTVLGLNTGMRHKEIRTLRWKNLDLENRVLRVGESKTEAGKGRPIPLTQPAWAVLETWSSRFPDRKPEHFVFPACENGKVDPERPIANWRTAWRRACQKAKLAGLRFHDLRHTAVTKLLEHGAPIAVVAQILGWSASTAVRMTKRYGHIRPEAQRQALEAVATARIQPTVHQFVHQANSGLEWKRPN